MKHLFVLFCICSSLFSFAQSQNLQPLLDRGIALHDQGQYDKAIAIYDKLIQTDDQFFAAWYEKTSTQYASGKYQDCADLCEQVLKKFPDNSQDANVYSNYGSALDALGRADEALHIYSTGIERFPHFYLLYFNRGLTEYSKKDMPPAIRDFEAAIMLRPMHASSHQYLAYAVYDENKMAAVLSLSTFLLLEPDGSRAKKNLASLLKLLQAHVEEGSGKSINISLSEDLLATQQKDTDDFHQQALQIRMQTALDMDDIFHNAAPAAKLKNKMQVFADSNMPRSRNGFFTQFYLPLWTQLKTDGLLEAACFYLYASADDPRNKQWIDAHQKEMKNVEQWIADYRWTN